MAKTAKSSTYRSKQQVRKDIKQCKKNAETNKDNAREGKTPA